MSKPDYLLSVLADKGQVFVHADRKGLTRLIDELVSLRDKVDAGVCEHVHLMSSAWGGSDLSEEKGCGEGDLADHLKIYAWTDQWAVKHGFKKQH